MKTLRTIVGILLLSLVSAGVWGQDRELSVAERNAAQGFNDTIDRLAPDFVTVSLVVADPDEVLYSTLGHAALHLQCPVFGLDYIFTYESENVRDKIWTFLKGGLKMGMFAMEPEDFLEGYRIACRGVREYRLNLSPVQEQRLWEVMDKHVMEGSNLSYDYFHRGCAKSIVRVMHEAIGRTAIHYAPWPDKYTKQTQREIVRNFITGAPWEEFVMYFLIGIDGDMDYPCEQKLIVPTDLVEVWQHAKLDNGEFVLDSSPHILLDATKYNEGTWFTPLLVSIILLLLTIGSFSTLWCKHPVMKKAGGAVDILMMSVVAISGFVMTYLIGFSGLPCTDWNWLIIPFNILPVVFWLWRQYWALPYAAVVFVWCLVMTGEWFWGHVIVDWPHILLALAFGVILLKQSPFLAHRAGKM